MMQLNEAQEAFYDDIREKKKAASGVHSKTGKRGFVGNMKFPTDIMSRKDKYNHRKAGKVVTTNIYDEILPIAEFEALEDYEKKNRLAYWRNKFTNKEICEAMGIWNNKYYKIVQELNLPKAPRTDNGKTSRKGAVIIASKKPAEAIQAPSEAITPEVQEIIVNGLHLSFNGTYSPEQIIKQFLKFGALLEDDENEYYIELKLMQKAPRK